jgi:hypothetical protein
MDYLKTGFIDHATNSGLSQDEAAYLWKRAMDYPGTSGVFKQLDNNQNETASIHPEELSSLSKLMEQEKVQKELQAIKQQLGI